MPIRTKRVAPWKPHKFKTDNDLDDIEEKDEPKNGKKIRHPKDKWDDRFFLTVYQLARDERTPTEIAAALGVDHHTLLSWRKAKPALEEAYQKGKMKSTQRFENYIYDRLPPKLQTLWDKIQKFDETDNALQKIMGLMENHGMRARQQLFIQALVSKNFNPSKACKAIGISYTQLMTWARTDSNFGELLNEIEWHKKNFYEDSLFDLVKNGNPAATIFINKTKNQDRGYGAKLQVEHSGDINHNHRQMLDLDSLNLPLDLRKQLVDHIEEHRIKALPAPKNTESENIIDAKFEDITSQDEEEEAA